MLSLEKLNPDPRLRPFVRQYVQRKTFKSQPEIIEPVVARLGTMLEFQFARPYLIPIYETEKILISPRITVIGPITYRRVRLVIGNNVEALAVLFQPQGFRALFGIPTSRLTNVGLDASGFSGCNLSGLYEQLGNAPSFGQRVELLDYFLTLQLSKSTPLDRVHRALNQLMFTQHHVKISDLALQAGVTVRQLERKSLEYTGVAPITLARIARFQQVLKMKKVGSSNWAEVAHSLGYHDQMHMIRDFRNFAGDSPSRASDQIHSDHLINF